MRSSAELRALVDEDRSLAVGDRVTVSWGYGRNFLARGPGEIVKVNTKSVRVRLLDSVAVIGSQTVSWEYGHVLTGIPRFAQFFDANGRWDEWNRVAKIHPENKSQD